MPDRAALVTVLVAGGPDARAAAEQLYRRIHPGLLAGFTAHTGDPVAAQALTERTTIQVLHRLNHLGDGDLDAFVAVIALEVMLAA